jgi:hypothetical protein
MHDGWDSPGVPNIMYVAATRHRKELIIIADEKSTLRTINVDTLQRYVQPLGRPVAKPRVLRPSAPPDKLGVLDLLRHLDSVTTYEMANLVEVVSREWIARPEVEAKTAVEFEAKDGKGYAESVAHLYGIVIPRVAELHLRNATDFGLDTYCPLVLDTEKEAARHEGALTRAAYNSYPLGFWDSVHEAAIVDPAERTFVQWFKLAVAQNAIQDGAHHTARQILHYDWIDEPFVDSCVVCVDQVMEDLAGDFEVRASTTVEGKTIVGYLDFVEKEADVVWEFKCSKGVQTNHMLQLACYLAITGKQTGRLYAILSGEIETIRLKDGPGLLRLALSKYRKKVDGDIHEDIAKFMERFEIPNAMGGDEDMISPLFETALTLDDMY